MRLSSSSSELFGHLTGASAVDGEVGDLAWVRAMLDAERALAAAQSRAGLLPPGAAEAVATAVDEVWAGGAVDVAELGRGAPASGTPVVPLVRALRAKLPADIANSVHYGATSQDILDTAASLVAFRALVPIRAALDAVATACARLAAAHRDTLMPGRTLGQHAVPTTFGLRCAGWLVAADEARAGLSHVPLAVQYGGAAGTLAAVGSTGPRVAALFAEELGLAEPVLPWHTNRTRFAGLAGALGVAAGVLGKIALDVVLLAQTEVAEVAEAEGGGSSAMPHKQNPVRAVLVRAAALRAPALVATMLAAMPQEHERAAGAWQAEWETVTELLRLVGGAAAHTAALLAGLRVDAERMRRNLDVAGGLVMAEAVATSLTTALGREGAYDLVAAASREAAATGRPLREVLLERPMVRLHLPPADLDSALDPAGYLGSAGKFVDRALAAHATFRKELEVADGAGRAGA